MLEKMGAFFDRRLEGYEDHQLTAIDSAGEFYPFTARCLPQRPEADCREQYRQWRRAVERSLRWAENDA